MVNEQMKLYTSETWIRDLDEEIANLPELKLLSDKRILITGATGLICSAVVDLLIRYNETMNSQISILVAGRSIDKLKNRFFPYSSKSYMKCVYFDATTIKDDSDLEADYIIHGASNASPNKIILEPVETMMSNLLGLKRLLDQAKNHNSRRLLFVSSSEVYGKKENNRPFNENEYGYIDLLNSRNSYSVGKRAAETLCASYYDEYDVDYVIIRPGHIYGPTAGETDNRVSSSWAFAAARGEDIIMKSDGAQVRSYCYCLDCANAILKVLLDGECGKAYNVSNPESVISIKEMAQLLSESAGVKLIYVMPTESEKKGFNPMLNSSLDASSLINLGWHGLFNAEKGFIHTIKVIKESTESGNM